MSPLYDITRFGRIILLCILLLEWFALPTQYYLLVSTSELGWFSSLIRFFSFFTILTNTVVAVCATVVFFRKPSRLYSFFTQYNTLTAITVYIIVVGGVYNTILRSLYDIIGMHLVVSEIFHTVVPLLFFVYWIVYVPKRYTKWKNIFKWLVYPILYIIYTLLHGLYTNFYPYPFIDVTKIGLTQALVNGLFVLFAFIVLSLIFMSIGNGRKENEWQKS